MSNPIVDRLLRSRSSLRLKESMSLFEAEADEEYAELNDEFPGAGDDESEDIPETPEDDIDTPDVEDPADDSTAPEQGSPTSAPSSSSLPDFSNPADTDSEESAPEESTSDNRDDSDLETYENPLDNQYAIHYTLGSEVSLYIDGDTNVDSRDGIVDGYDTEGFYRVKWNDGTVTNGLTDIALKELVSTMKECVCGGTEFINEGTKIVCDRCGRPIKEGATLLAMEDDKGKKNKIRSELHPVSTAVKPSIAEAIKKAFKGEKLQEDDEVDEEGSVFDALKKNLDNEFWTRQNELVDDIEELGYTVEEINGEYVVVSHPDEEDDVYQIYLGGTSRTMTLDFRRTRIL